MHLLYLFVLQFLHIVEELRPKTDIEVLANAPDDLLSDAPLGGAHLLLLAPEVVLVLLQDVAHRHLGRQLEQLLLVNNKIPVIHQDIFKLLR